MIQNHTVLQKSSKKKEWNSNKSKRPILIYKSANGFILVDGCIVLRWYNSAIIIVCGCGPALEVVQSRTIEKIHLHDLMEIQIHSIEPPVSVAGARSLINPTRPRWVNKTNATYLFYIGFPAFDEDWQLSGDRQRHLTTYPSIYPQSVLRLWWCGCSLCCCHVHVSSWIGWCVQLWKELLTQPSIIGCGYTGTEFMLPNRPHEISVGSQLVAGAQKKNDRTKLNW